MMLEKVFTIHNDYKLDNADVSTRKDLFAYCESVSSARFVFNPNTNNNNYSNSNKKGHTS